MLAGIRAGLAANPFIPHRGITGPPIHSFNGPACLSATLAGRRGTGRFPVRPVG